MTYAIDPSLPVVWRSPRSFQIGVDAPVALIEDAGRLEERVLSVLVRGASRGALELAAAGTGEEHRLDELLDRLSPALGRRPAATPSRPDAPVLVTGGGVGADTLRLVLSARGLEVVDQPTTGRPPAVAVLVARYAVAPTRHLSLLRADVPHLPVVFGDSAVTVGPFVTPGVGPCLHCVEAHRRDADASWPAMAAQLYDRRSPLETTAVSWDVALVVARMVVDLVSGARTPRVGIERVHRPADGTISARRRDPHPLCGCLAPEGNATAGDAASRPAAPLRTTTGSSVDVPA